ncbi:Phage XkdN-like protein [compost metagenome]
MNGETEDKRIAQEELLDNETDILRGLLDAAANTEEERKVIEIARKGKVFFRFSIRPLSEADYNACRDKATKYKKNRRLGGIKMPDDTDAARYRSSLIYEATVSEDQKKIWNNKAAWDQLNVLSGVQLIDKVLLPGEKEAVIEQIDRLSGYDLDDEEDNEAEEVVKN